MRKFNKLISMLLAVLMLISSVTAMFTVQVFAADENTTGGNNTYLGF